MIPENPVASGMFCLELTVPEEAIDQNGHVNNVAYVQWMQDAAVRHSEASGGTQAMLAAGGTWVVRSHRIEYLTPAFAGDQIQAVTWVADYRRATSLRRYRFTRVTDGKVLARGETDWVFVSTATGRPRSIPDAVKVCFVVLPHLK